MRRMLCSLMFCVTLCATLCAAEEALGAYRYYDQAGAWDISYDDENHECFAQVVHSDQSQFLIGRTTAGATYIIALNPRWGFVEGRQYELALGFANPNWSSVRRWSGFFGAFKPTIVFATNLSSAFLEDLARAATVTFYYSGSYAGSFNLIGADNAIQKIEQCRSYLGKPQARIMTGSGIYVSASEQMPGTILTNEHVVHACSAISVGYPGGQYVSAEAFAHDENNDLALLRAVLPSKGQAAFSTNSELGQDVAVFGFPLAGTLSPGGNFTTGTISALDLANDRRYLQMTNPVQPGNSGGPLLDRKGNVIGIVVAQGDPSRLENVNFAIKSATAISFLEANSIPYVSVHRWLPRFWPGVAKTAQTFTVQIVCSEQNFASPTPPPQPPPPPQSQQLPPPQPQGPPTRTMTMRVRVVQDLTLRIAPDPYSEKVIVGPPLNDAIPADAIVELHYSNLSTDCRRYDVDARHTVWCPVFYGDHWGWVNAFYLDTGAANWGGRLSCSIDQTSRGCGQPAPTSPQQTVAARTIADLTLRTRADPNSQKVLEKIPKGSQVTITEPCKVWMGSGRGAQDADNIWCPVSYGNYQGWANAYYLAAADGRRLACIRYPRAEGCPPPIYGSR